MSYTEMFKVPESGELECIAEFKNAFLSAWYVWSKMAGAYLYQDASHLMFTKNMQPVWDLWKRQDIPLDHRIIIAFTFDNVMVKRVGNYMVELVNGDRLLAVSGQDPRCLHGFDPNTTKVVPTGQLELIHDDVWGLIEHRYSAVTE